MNYLTRREVSEVALKLYDSASKNFKDIEDYPSNKEITLEDISIYETSETVIAFTEFKVNSEQNGERICAIKKDLKGSTWELVEEEELYNLVMGLVTNKGNYKEIQVVDEESEPLESVTVEGKSGKIGRRVGLRKVAIMSTNETGFLHQFMQETNSFGNIGVVGVVELENGQLTTASVNSITFID